jgi:hypothetical protein
MMSQSQMGLIYCVSRPPITTGTHLAPLHRCTRHTEADFPALILPSALPAGATDRKIETLSAF